MTAVKCIEFVSEALSTLIKAYEEAENQTKSVTAIGQAIRVLEDIRLGDFRNGSEVE